MAEGDIEFLGRSDHQVKLRGHRIEPGDIEATLERHPAVRQAVVSVQEDSPGEKRLVAYLVSYQDLSFDIEEIREFSKTYLPEYMIPAGWVKLENMPLTPNGKICRHALPAAEQRNLIDERILTPPDSPLEQVLVGIWCDILNLDEVGIYENFFKIGGHSILASRLISSLRETFKIELPLRALFEAPTIAALAAAMVKDTEQGIKVQRIAELLLSVADYSDDEVESRLRDSRFLL
jgi:hypothetical protein